MRRRWRTGLALLLSATLLAACATAYTPSPRTDAAKLRLRLGAGSGFANMAGNLRVVDATGRCGPPVRYPQLMAYAGPSADTRGPQGGLPPPTYPRVDMVGSPDPLRSDVVELRVDPGRYAVLLFGLRGTMQCSLTAEVDLAAGGEHELTFTFDGLQRRCVVVGSRVEPGGGWKPLRVRPDAEPCKG